MIVNDIDKRIHSSISIRKDSFTEVYDVKSEIGRGKFAVVKRCVHRATSVDYAAKFLHKRRRGRDSRVDVLHEVDMLLMTSDHPHIINLVEVFETSHDFVLITEYVPGGELFQHIDVDGKIDEKTTVRLLRQILSGVNFVHNNDILHLDIKPQNILLTDVPSAGDVKLCDFGLARPFNRGSDVIELVGTLDYVAPEVLDYVALSAACDMWSVGVLAYVMLTGHSPFAGESRQETLLNISQVNLEFPEELFGSVSESAIDFISRLLVKQPGDRMTAKQCLDHCWLAAASEHHVNSVADVQLSQLDESGADCNAVAALSYSLTTSSPSVPRARIASSVDSPSRQRRALVTTLTSDDDILINHEPTKKCRCEIDEVKQLASCVSTTTVSTLMTSHDVDAGAVTVNVVENIQNDTCVAEQLLSCVDALSSYKEVSLVLGPPPVCVNVNVSVA